MDVDNLLPDPLPLLALQLANLSTNYAQNMLLPLFWSKDSGKVRFQGEASGRSSWAVWLRVDRWMRVPAARVPFPKPYHPRSFLEEYPKKNNLVICRTQKLGEEPLGLRHLLGCRKTRRWKGRISMGDSMRDNSRIHTRFNIGY